MNMRSLEEFFDDVKPSKTPLKIAFIYIPLVCCIYIIFMHLSGIVKTMGIGSILSNTALRFMLQYTLPRLIHCLVYLFGASIPALIFRFVLYRKPIQKRVIALTMGLISFMSIGPFSAVLAFSAAGIAMERFFALPLPGEIGMSYYILRYGTIFRQPNGAPDICPTWWEI